MEKKDLLGVRKRTAPLAAKRRRKVVAPTEAGGAGRLAKAIADYLAFDSYMYAPLVSDPHLPSAAAAPPEKEAALVQKYRGSGELPSLPARSMDALELVDLCPFCIKL